MEARFSYGLVAAGPAIAAGCGDNTETMLTDGGADADLEVADAGTPDASPPDLLSMCGFEPVTDMVGGGPFSLRPGEWTDDTSMALCLAESLIECGGFNAPIRWSATSNGGRRVICRAPGSSSTSGTRRAKRLRGSWSVLGGMLSRPTWTVPSGCDRLGRESMPRIATPISKVLLE